MIEFPAIWLRYIFFILGGLLVLIALLQLQNSLRYGSRMPLNLFVSVLFVAGVAAIIGYSFTMTSSVDWTQSYSLSLPSISWPYIGS